jgi:hypothetical protein
MNESGHSSHESSTAVDLSCFFKADNGFHSEQVRQLSNVLNSHPHIAAQDAPQSVVADSLVLAGKGPGGAVVTDRDGMA